MVPEKSVKEGEDDDVTLKSQLMVSLHRGPVKSELQKLIRRASWFTFVEACKEARDMEGEALGEDGAAGADAHHMMVPRAANLPGLRKEGGLLPSLKEEI